MPVPAPPINVVATVDANDQITVSWDYDPTWFAFDGDDGSLGGFNEGMWYSSDSIDHFEIEISRDGIGYKTPSGGPTTVTYDESTSYSATYGPNSDQPYGTQVGIDSMFKFRVRGVNSDGSSTWASSGLVYTTAIPPHNPSVSRPSSTEFEVTCETKSDISSGVVVEARKDTGSGYGNWRWLDIVGDTGGTISQGDGENITIEEDARYQLRLYHYVSEDRDKDSPHVYADYGNSGNVYFEDDFESGDISAWDSSYGGHSVGTGGHANTGIGGADEGTYYLKGYGQDSTDASWVQKDLGDLSSETDVLVKCAFAVGSLDNAGENFNIEWYNGSSWQVLEEFYYEYNKQGWFEVSSLVPDSWLSTDSRIRVGDTTSDGMYGGDYFAVDRVVVSDVLHEVTTPAAPSNLSLDTSTEGEITATWTENASLGTEVSSYSKAWVDLYGNRQDTIFGSGSTFSPADDGELYDFKAVHLYEQNRHGGHESWVTSDSITDSAVTVLPEPKNPTLTTTSDTSLEGTWDDVSNNEDGHEVYYREAGASSWTKLSTLGSGVESETIGSLDQDTKYEFRVDNYTEHTTSQSQVVSSSTFLNETRNTSTHSSSAFSLSRRVVDLLEAIGSHGRPAASSSIRQVDVGVQTASLTAEFYDTQSYYNSNGHPSSKSGLDQFYDASNSRVSKEYEGPHGRNTFNQGDGGQTTTTGTVNSLPPYITRSDGYSWKVSGKFVAPETGTYTFGIDGDDAMDIEIAGTIVTGWYDGHGFDGSLSNHEGTIDLVEGEEYQFTARYEEGGGGSGMTVGWKKPSDTEYKLFPAGKLNALNSYSDSIRGGVDTTIDLTEPVSSHATSSGSTSAGVIDVGYGVDSHSNTADSSSLRVTDVLANPTSHLNASFSSNQRSGVNFQRQSDLSHLNTSSSLSSRAVDLLALPSSHLSKVENWDVTHGNFVTDRVWEGDNSFYSSENYTGEQARWTPFDTGKEVQSFTYYWREQGSSYGGGIRFVNSDGDYEFGVATDNPAWVIDDANGTREPAAEGTGYYKWVRFTITFDWANGTFSVDFESFGSDGTTYQESGIPLKQGVDIEKIELWNYHDNNGWGDGQLDMWWDSLSFTESDGTTTETLTGAGNSTAERLNSLNRPSQSHSATFDSSALRVVDLLGTVSSHSSPANSSISVLIDMLAEPVSHLDVSGSSSDRGALTYAIRGADSQLPGIDTDSIRVIDLIESVESHSKHFRSSIYNDRTSLELLDQEITWQKDEVAWYTNWFQESKILGSEDSLAVRSLVIEDSKEPAATVVLQYDENGSGDVDRESEPVRLGRDQSVEKFSGVPVDEDGYYRLKITEYSGYNSLYELNTAIIH